MHTRIRYILWLVVMIGCGPGVSDEELGRIVFEVPEIPAPYEPYELPDLTASPEEALEQQGDSRETIESSERSAESRGQIGPPSGTAAPGASAQADE